MKTWISMKKLAGTLFLGALTLVVGCESVGILQRDSIADRRSGDSRRDQVYGTVQDVDERRREIRLRTEDGRITVIKYDSNTRTSDGSRDIRADSLRSGDWVSVRFGRNSGGEQYAEAIRIEDRRGSGLR